MHPVDELLEWLPVCDFGVLEIGFAPHGRDFNLVVQDVLRSPGTHRVAFTHVVEIAYETRVRDESWRLSWDDTFTDYAAWEAAGCPSGYVWGVNWADAKPGLRALRDSQEATEWSERLNRPMYAALLETNQYSLHLVFHSVRYEKISDEIEPVSRTIVPLPAPDQ